MCRHWHEAARARRPRVRRASFVALIAGVLLGAVAPSAQCYDQPTEGYSATEVRAAAEEKLEKELSSLRQAGLLNRKGRSFERLQRVFARVIAAAISRSELARTLDWALYVPDERLARAYSTGSGKIVVSARFLERYAPDDDELGLVIGHEVAHALCEHERVELSLIRARNAPYPLEARYAIEYLETEPWVGEHIAPLVRAHERVADRLGLELAAAAGSDPVKALAFFDTVRRVDRECGFERATHDSPAQRQATLRMAARRLRAQGVKAAEWNCSL